MTNLIHPRGFWRARVKKYNARWFAKTCRPHPKPPEIEHLFSSGLYAGDPTRYWAFETEEERNRFVMCHRGAQTLDEDPCP